MNKAIWMIAGGAMQEVAAKHIVESGYKLILTDTNKSAVCRKYAERFLNIDTFDVKAHVEASKYLREDYDIKGVLTISADCHHTVNSLAKHLGLHHLDPKISNICRNKHLTRELLSKAGIIQPKFSFFNNISAARIWESMQAEKLVAKATDNSGSRGFSIISKENGLTDDQYYEAVKMGTTGLMIIEEQLYPKADEISESSVETLWQNGEMKVINWVDRIFCRDLELLGLKDQNFQIGDGIEIGHLNPSIRSNAVKKNAEKDIYLAGLALGMDSQPGAHILKADIFFSSKGPIILELTPRCSGGWDSSGTSRNRGARIAEGVVYMATGGIMTAEKWQEFFSFKPDTSSVVVAKIPQNDKDCIGREFRILSGNQTPTELLNIGLKSIEEEECHV